MSGENKLKIYCETSFWSWLVSKPSSDPDHAVKQAWTRKWWETERANCDLLVSDYVTTEAGRGNIEQVHARLAVIEGIAVADVSAPEVEALANALLAAHAVPASETTDAYHIATASVAGADVLLTWNCRHLANIHTFPLTRRVVERAGFHCPVIITPRTFLENSQLEDSHD